jgi:hypothetical protein
MDEPAKQYSTDGMTELIGFVSWVVDVQFGMREKPIRNDLIAETMLGLVRLWMTPKGSGKRNKSTVRYEVLNARRRLGLSTLKNSLKGQYFWHHSVVLETDTIRVDGDGEETSVFDTIPAPEPTRERAILELTRLRLKLTGKDLAIFDMMIRGCDAHEIGEHFGVCESMARNYTNGIVAALRQAVREEYDYAQSAIDGLSDRLRGNTPDPETVDDPDDPEKCERRSSPANRPERHVRRWTGVKVARHVHRHDEAVIRTKADYNRPRVRLEGRAGIDHLRSLGLMRKAGV